MSLQQAVTPIPAPYRDHLGPQLGPVSAVGKGGEDEGDEAPVLLQKARQMFVLTDLKIFNFGIC